ncbi:MAG TPA: hypothetical protein VF652_08655 [Allosphingosinicella sp.]
MVYSFLVHAGDDKARLAPIVRKLISEGISLWIDDPFHLDLGLDRSEIQQLGGYIVPGADWPRQRDLALQYASSVLIGVSAACLEPMRSQVRAELAIADFRELNDGTPIFPLALSATELDGAASLIGRRQSFKTYVEVGETGFQLTQRGDRGVDELVEALRACRGAAADPVKSKRSPLEVASPYFADRAAQRQNLSSALSRTRNQVEAPRILPIVTGAYEDRPDKFALSQLPQRLLPRVMRVNECEAISIGWPYCALSSPQRALEILAYEIAELDPLPRAAVLYTQPPPGNLQSPEDVKACLWLWCKFWSSPENSETMRSCLPVIDLRVEERESPFASLWRRRAAFRLEQQLPAIVSDLAEQLPDLTILTLPPLAPVSWNCVEDWLREEVSPLLGDYRTGRYRSLLRRGFTKQGMHMEPWARRAHDVYFGLENLGS